MSAWAQVGAKVVCINADPYTHRHLIEGAGFKPNLIAGFPLVKGETYTIESVVAHPVLAATCIRLVEVASRGSSAIGDDPGYIISRFRPLVTKTLEQDLAIFLPLLTDLRVGTDA